MNEVYVLDACALIASLKNENGADIVDEVYEKADNGEAKLLINIINLYEVYYGFYREKGKEYADKIIDGVKKSVVTICEFDNEVFTIGGKLKAYNKLSLADSIVLAQAIITGGALLTSDHHEFDIIEREGRENINFKWIR